MNLISASAGGLLDPKPPLTSAHRTLLQIPYGFLHGKLVAPHEAPRGLSDVICIECEGALVAAQGDIVRPYFRHESGIDLCDYAGESMRHRLTKIALAERMKRALSEGSELPIVWRCSCAKDKHTGNLLKGATHISVDDRKVGPFMPDIGIFEDNRCRAFVEIEQSHANTDEKIAYCEGHNISLVNIDIRLDSDPVAFVRQTPLSIGYNRCLHRLGRICYCGDSKLPGSDLCTKCLRRRNGIGIDIAGSYRIQQPRFGTWAATVTGADGKEWEYTGRDTSSEGTLAKMLRGALVELGKVWKGTYEVRIDSTNAPLSSQEARPTFSGRVVPNRYWNSIKDSLGHPQPERRGRLVADRPTLQRAIQSARHEFVKSNA